MRQDRFEGYRKSELHHEVVAVSDDYTCADTDRYLVVDLGAVTKTITLPPPVGMAGAFVVIEVVDIDNGGILNISTPNANPELDTDLDQIDNSAGLETFPDGWVLFCDGEGWFPVHVPTNLGGS